MTPDTSRVIWFLYHDMSILTYHAICIKMHHVDRIQSKFFWCKDKFADCRFALDRSGCIRTDNQAYEVSKRDSRMLWEHWKIDCTTIGACGTQCFESRRCDSVRFLAVLPGSCMSLQVHKMTMSIRSNLWRLTRLTSTGPCLKRSQEYGWASPCATCLGQTKKNKKDWNQYKPNCVNVGFNGQRAWDAWGPWCLRWGFRPTMEMITTWLYKPSGGGLSLRIGFLSWISFQYSVLVCFYGGIGGRIGAWCTGHASKGELGLARFKRQVTLSWRM